MVVRTVTVGSKSDVLKGKAEMTEKGLTKEQLEHKKTTKKSGCPDSLNVWRKCVEDTRKECDTKTVPVKDSAHYKRAKELYASLKKEKSNDD